MLEIIILVAFVWLMVCAVTLALKVTWSVTKVVASILIGLALPVLLVCFLFVGGIALLLPVALIGIAVGILKSCV